MTSSKRTRLLTAPALLIATLPMVAACANDLASDGSRVASSQTHIVSGVDPSRVASDSWMGSIDDSINIAQLSIPGTHDSCARYEPWPGTARCQALSIAEQLAAGVRYLDMRCGNVENSFGLYHYSIFQFITFDEVLSTIYDFLASHPSETVMMAVREEISPSDSSNTFEQTFDAYTSAHPDRWYLSDSLPNLGSARGKIVLLRRFHADTLPKGIDATVWSDNRLFAIESSKLSVQDHYEVPNAEAKWNDVMETFNLASGSDHPDYLYLNNLSGYVKGIFGIPNITAVSNAINPRAAEYLTAHPTGRFGIVAMDFADNAKASLVLRTNFSGGNTAR